MNSRERARQVKFRDLQRKRKVPLPSALWDSEFFDQVEERALPLVSEDLREAAIMLGAATAMTLTVNGHNRNSDGDSLHWLSFRNNAIAAREIQRVMIALESANIDALVCARKGKVAFRYWARPRRNCFYEEKVVL